MTASVQGRCAHLTGLGVELLSSDGASVDQREHLRLLGIGLEADACAQKPDYTPLAAIGGVRNDDDTASQHRRLLNARLLSGLHDRSAAATLKTGLHLFRHARRGDPGGVNTEFDQVGLDILESMRVSPAWLLLLAALFERCAIRLAGTDPSAPADIAISQELHDDEPIMTMSLHIGGGVIWNGEGVDTGRPLPHTIQEAAEGSPLSRLVGHPVLDRHALTVQEVRPNGFLDVGHVPYRAIDWGSGFDPSMRAARKSLPA